MFFMFLSIIFLTTACVARIILFIFLVMYWQLGVFFFWVNIIFLSTINNANSCQLVLVKLRWINNMSMLQWFEPQINNVLFSVFRLVRLAGVIRRIKSLPKIEWVWPVVLSSLFCYILWVLLISQRVDWCVVSSKNNIAVVFF